MSSELAEFLKMRAGGCGDRPLLSGEDALTSYPDFNKMTERLAMDWRKWVLSPGEKFSEIETVEKLSSMFDRLYNKFLRR